MGVYSTVDISREDAKRVIHALVDSMDDEQLEDTLFAMLKNEILYNYRISEDPDIDATEILRMVE